MSEQAYGNRDRAIRTQISGIGRFIGKIAHGMGQHVKAVAETHDAARRIDHLAERYCAMNTSELADIGLTRDQIASELRRTLCG